MERIAFEAVRMALRWMSVAEWQEGAAHTHKFCCRAAEAELSEYQAQLRAGEAEFAAELESLATRRRSLEASLRDSSATLADAEAEVAETRMQSLGLRAQLEVLEAARDEIAAQEHQASMQQREEVKRLESLAANLASEAKEISQRHVKELQKAQERRESEKTQEDCKKYRDMSQTMSLSTTSDVRWVAKAEQRLGSFLRQLGEERCRGLELARELTAARDAAAAAGAPLQTKPVRRSRSAKSAKSTKVMSWPNTDLQETWSASALRMQRELELLQRWKADALSVLQQMQVDVSSAQEKGLVASQPPEGMAGWQWYFLSVLILRRSCVADSCEGDSCLDQNSLLQTADRSRQLSTETGTCSVGAHVACPGSSAFCAGNECCPGAPTFPCPSASPDFVGCGSTKKLFSCTGSKPSEAPAPAPAPEAKEVQQASGDLLLTMHLVNREWADGVIFCRGPASELRRSAWQSSRGSQTQRPGEGL
eukprot:g8059.t1